MVLAILKVFLSLKIYKGELDNDLPCLFLSSFGSFLRDSKNDQNLIRLSYRNKANYKI